MGLSKQSGNMYDFVTHMWSVLKGKCIHDCSYCYMRRFPMPPIHIDEKEFKTQFGEGKFIFVCHTADLMASDIPNEWIDKVLAHCNKFPKNRYLFQSKNPMRFLDFKDKFPKDCILATTIETNRTEYVESKAPTYVERIDALKILSDNGFETMLTIEPIFDFDLEDFVALISRGNPVWINIGADSKKHSLPEPSKEKIKALISELSKKTQIKLKNNLDRILG